MSFDSVLGQEDAVEILQDEIEKERISHAYLFSGQSGIGKSKLGYEFAKAVFCQELKIDSCGKCISCRKMEHQNHPDFKIISILENKNNISIDQIRELKKEIAYKPYESEKKIYIIESADQMSKEAANSLLKTLEEPPSFATIILLAEDTSRLLPTIISRCQQLKLKNLALSEIKKLLLEKGIAADKAEILSRTAHGSPGKALAAAEKENFFASRKEIYDFLTEIEKKNSIEIFKLTKKLTSLLKADFPCFDLLSDWYRDIMMIKQDYLEAVKNKDYLKELKRLAAKMNQNEIINKLALIARTEEYISRNVRAKLSLQVLFFKLRQPDSE